MFQRLTQILFALTLIGALASSAGAVNRIDMEVEGCLIEPPDSAGITNNLAINTPVTLKFNVTTDVLLDGAVLGFVIYSPNSSITTITHIQQQMFEPWSTIWDVTSGGVLIDSGLNGLLPDLFLTGGASFTPNFPTGTDVNFLDVEFQLSSEIGVICVDSAFFPPAGDWIFSAAGGSLIPEWGGGPDGGYCFKTFEPSNQPCVFTNFPGTLPITVCGAGATFDFDATDADGPAPCTFSLISGPGSIDSSTGLYSVGVIRLEEFQRAQVRVRVEDGAGAGCERTFIVEVLDTVVVEEDNTSSLGLFRILVAPDFRDLMLDYPGYDGLDRLTSAVLSDRNTKIGRSVVLVNGDSCDVNGIPVGPAGTLISDSDFPLVPAGFDGPPGTLEVHTELRSLNLTSFLGPVGMAVRGGVMAPDQPISPGEVQSHDPSGNFADFFPGRSFFDVFVEVDLPAGGNAPFPGATLINQTPIVVTNDTLVKFPPKVVYIHDNPEAVKVFFKNDGPGGVWSAGDFFGWLVLAGHGIDFDTVSSVGTGATRGGQMTDLDLFMQIVESLPENCCLVAGDANGDGKVNISDVTFLIARIFAGGEAPPCQDQADADGNNKLNIADVTYLIARIFAGGPAPVCGTTKS